MRKLQIQRGDNPDLAASESIIMKSVLSLANEIPATISTVHGFQNTLELVPRFYPASVIMPVKYSASYENSIP